MSTSCNSYDPLDPISQEAEETSAVGEIAAESSEIARAAKQDFNFLGMLVAPEEFILHFQQQN